MTDAEKWQKMVEYCESIRSGNTGSHYFDSNAVLWGRDRIAELEAQPSAEPTDERMNQNWLQSVCSRALHLHAQGESHYDAAGKAAEEAIAALSTREGE